MNSGAFNDDIFNVHFFDWSGLLIIQFCARQIASLFRKKVFVIFGPCILNCFGYFGPVKRFEETWVAYCFINSHKGMFWVIAKTSHKSHLGLIIMVFYLADKFIPIHIRHGNISKD